MQPSSSLPHLPQSAAPAPYSASDEQALIDEFITVTGHQPNHEELAFLHNLAKAHRSLSFAQYGKFDYSALSNLAPVAERYLLLDAIARRLSFFDWFAEPPRSPLSFWPYIALLFTERSISLPPFTQPFDRLDKTRTAR